MHSKDTVTITGKTDTLRKNVEVRIMEGQRNFNVRSVERNIVDSVGQGVARHPKKIQRKEDGTETQKETAREPRKVESSEWKRRKPRERKRSRKAGTTSQRNHRTSRGTGGLADRDNGPNDLGAKKLTR